ncbi:hypothetical protein Trydic_g1274 [Trypoxylus dichotomus]
MLEQNELPHTFPKPKTGRNVLFCRLRKTGFNTRYANISQPKQMGAVHLEEQVLDALQEYPSVNARQLPSTLSIPSNKTVQLILGKIYLHQCNVSNVQPFCENDNVLRLNLCNIIVNRI